MNVVIDTNTWISALISKAVASNSKVIITDNKKDLESGELKFNFEVLTPKEFLERNNHEYTYT